MPRSLYYTLIVSLGGFIFGFDASVISGVVSFVTDEFGLSTWQQGFVVSSPTLGGILATLCAGPLADKVGRKPILITVAALYLVSALFSALATSFEMLVVARFIGGMAFCSLMLAPMYIAEISEAAKRGKRVSFNQLNIVLGFSAAYFANYAFLTLSGLEHELIKALGIDNHTWRWMLGAEIAPALAYFLLLFAVPESPRWLMIQERMQEAKQVLARLFTPNEGQRQMQEIEDSLQQAPMPLGEQLRFLCSPKLRTAMLIGLIVGIVQQVSGVNAIYFYAPTIFEQSGVGTNAAFAQAIWVGIINVIFTLVAMALIDKVGRKPLLVVGLSGVFISMSVCAYGFSQASYQLTTDALTALPGSLDSAALIPLVGQVFDSDIAYKQALVALVGESAFNQHQGLLLQVAANMNATLILVGILGFVAAFAVSLGPVMWVLFSEIFPNQMRGLAISAVGIVNSFMSFMVQLVFPWELANLGSAVTFLIYGLLAAMGLLLVWWKVPETKGKSLEALQQELQGQQT